MAELTSVDAPCLYAAERAESGSYRTYWHYRARRRRGIFLDYDDHETVTFHLDANGDSALKAANAALPHADAQYRTDADRCPGSLGFDSIEPNSETAIRRRHDHALTERILFLLASAVITGIGLWAWCLVDEFQVGLR
jgi:hypothetical protein